MQHTCGISENGNCIKHSEFMSDTFCDITEKKRCKLKERIKQYKQDLKLFFTDVFKSKLSYYDKSVREINMGKLLSSLGNPSYINVFQRFPLFIQQGIEKTFVRYVRQHGTTKRKSIQKFSSMLQTIVENDTFSILDEKDKTMLENIQKKISKQLVSSGKKGPRELPSFITQRVVTKEKEQEEKQEEEDKKRYREHRKQIMKRIHEKELEEKKLESQRISLYIKEKEKEAQENERLNKIIEKKVNTNMSKPEIKDNQNNIIHSDDLSIPDTLSMDSDRDTIRSDVTQNNVIYEEDIPSNISDLESVISADDVSDLKTYNTNVDTGFVITRKELNKTNINLLDEIKESVFSTNIRIFSVKQPWAWAIVNGYKTIENRKVPFPTTLPLPCWVVIHASKTPYTSKTFEKELGLLRNELKCSGFGSVDIPHKSSFRYGQIVGMAKFIRSGKTPKDLDNVWWHKDDGYVYEVGASARYDKQLHAKGQLGFGKLTNQPSILQTLQTGFKQNMWQNKYLKMKFNLRYT